MGTPQTVLKKKKKKKKKAVLKEFIAVQRYVTSTKCKLRIFRSSQCGAGETNLTSNYEVKGLIPGLTHWVKDPACSPKKTKKKKKKRRRNF